MRCGTTARALALIILAFAWRPAVGQEATGVAGREAAGTAAQQAALEAAWNHEILAIANLLIGGEYDEARAGATNLLADERLPEALALRARQLLAKADAKLKPSPGLLAERTFLVRLAVIGRGFGDGADGRLRISSQGLSFTGEGPPRASWIVHWPDLAAARPDDGYWDAPYPLVIVERGGKKHYLNYVDGNGHYLAGKEILEAIVKARQAANPSKATSGAGGPAPAGEGEKP